METLLTVYRAFLSHPDGTLRVVALSCVLTYKHPNLTRHEETLQHLLDDMLWLDKLMPRTDQCSWTRQFASSLESCWRKRGCSKGGDRRAVVLSVLAMCTEDELRLLIDLWLKPMGLSNLAWEEERFVLTKMPLSVSSKQEVGFLNLLSQVLRYLGLRVVSHRIWQALNKERYLNLSPCGWLPVLYNALHFMQDPEELTVCNKEAVMLGTDTHVVMEYGEEHAVKIQTSPVVPSVDVQKVSNAINIRLLPALLSYLENQDENTSISLCEELLVTTTHHVRHCIVTARTTAIWASSSHMHLMQMAWGAIREGLKPQPYTTTLQFTKLSLPTTLLTCFKMAWQKQ
ncbi:hypothetical protein JVT61DRAFT_12165 [Boletus reticuloceps]|uniref:U3 small nucleolar RNA-associated protein 20 N-terminal domain-containing protein n=1 Tax=Boletus reticuloceps TaxID=495285 RepID=A0A8I3A4D2_9AGAM|nr:hypothetical protein JVT61DRAFT_12165 [Boletus reticuloceps]